MSHINRLSISNFRGIKSLDAEFGDEKLVILIGRGDSGKSTILSAISAVLSPSWNLSFTDLDFHNQNTSEPIVIEAEISQLPSELLTERKFGFYLWNDLDEDNIEQYRLVIRLRVDHTLEPHWSVVYKGDGDIEDKSISANDRALFAVNYISDATDNQFAYNRQSPLYAVTKSTLEDNTSIEMVKSSLLRKMASSIDEAQLSPLKSPMPGLKATATKLGLTVNELSPQIDIKDNPYTGNSIALHEASLPYRLHGKGSKRLMSIAIQSELTKQGGIELIDEVEQGLEPDRITTIVRLLKQTKQGQIFITTHSLNVILEAVCNNLFKVDKQADHHYVHRIEPSLDACRRSNPQSLFALKAICCEGKTEYGYMRAIDEWVLNSTGENFSSKGVVLINAGGGDNHFKYAFALRKIGIEVCIFADDDKPKELRKRKLEAEQMAIPMYLCDSGNFLESQIIYDLPWPLLSDLINCPQTEFPKQNISIDENIKTEILSIPPVERQLEIRKFLIEQSTLEKKEWFKHIPGGEFLGALVANNLRALNPACKTRVNITQVLNWCGINGCKFA